MSNDMIRELFRGVETTLYERLRIIEDILTKQRVEGVNPHMEGVEKRLHAIADRMEAIETATNNQVKELHLRMDHYMGGLDALEEKMKMMREELRNSRRPDDRPVELVQALVSLDSLKVEIKAKEALAKAVHALPTPQVRKDEIVEVEEEEEVEIVEEEEEEVASEAAEEEEIVEEEVAEEEEESLTPFEFKGKTYYHDSDYKVYIPDEDGAVHDPIGIYDPQTKRIRRLT